MYPYTTFRLHLGVKMTHNSFPPNAVHLGSAMTHCKISWLPLLVLGLLLAFSVEVAESGFFGLGGGDKGGGGGGGGGDMGHHVMQDQHKLSTGWQEPGLWRPKWIMERSFAADETTGEPAHVDRVYLKLKSDRSLKVYSQKSRPRVELLKPRVEAEKKKKLFETAADSKEAEDVTASYLRAQKAQEEMAFQVPDGTWWWQDATPLPGGKVKIETREGKDKEERIRHDCSCDWGTLDGYSAKFQAGKIFKYKMTETGVPLGTYQAGTFTIRVSPHRPLVGKDFLAFE